MQLMHENSLDQIYIRVVEAGSLRSVAMELGIDPSSVSRKITALEDRLQAKLLRRSTKRSVPTEAGQRYYEGVRRLLDERAALEADVAGLIDEPRGRLRIGAPVDFGARFVAPVVAELLKAAPELDVEFVLGSRFENLTEAGLDAVVRIGTLSDSSLIAKRLGVVPRVIVASADYVEANGLPEKPADLPDHPFIFYRAGQRQLTISLARGRENAEIEVTGRVAANSVTAIRQLVQGGSGLHLGPLWAFEEDIANGRLVTVLDEWELAAFPLFVLWPQADFLPAKVREFAERMADAVAREPSLR